jgi:hypothetical protein
MLCTYHVVLDNDEEGRKSFETAKGKNLLTMKSCSFITVNGMRDSEFEDCVNPDIYEPALGKECGVYLRTSDFKSSSKKWSDRMSDVFKKQGKQWDDITEQRVKNIVATCIEKNPEKALIPERRSSIEALLRQVEEMIDY